MESVFESMLGFGPNFSQIPDELLEHTRILCKNGTLNASDIESKFEVPDLIWGKYFAERVDRLSALYYRLVVTENHCQNGFILFCESVNKDRFKVCIFDEKGAMLEEDESVKSRDGKSTQSILYFNSCPTYRLGELLPTTTTASSSTTSTSNINTTSSSHTNINYHQHKDLPPSLFRLDRFTSSTRQITPGNYLILVFGDNYVGKSTYRLIATLFKSTNDQTESIIKYDESVLKLKNDVAVLKQEYIAAKLAFQAVTETVHSMNQLVEKELDYRDKAYKRVLDSSIRSGATSSTSSNGVSIKGITDNMDANNNSNTNNDISGSSTTFHHVEHNDVIVPVRKRVATTSTLLLRKAATATTSVSTLSTSADTRTASSNNKNTNISSSLSSSASSSTNTATINNPRSHSSSISSSFTSTNRNSFVSNNTTTQNGAGTGANNNSSTNSTTSASSSGVPTFESVRAAGGWFSKTISSGINNFISSSPRKDPPPPSSSTTTTNTASTTTAAIRSPKSNNDSKSQQNISKNINNNTDTATAVEVIDPTLNIVRSDEGIQDFDDEVQGLFRKISTSNNSSSHHHSKNNGNSNEEEEDDDYGGSDSHKREKMIDIDITSLEQRMYLQEIYAPETPAATKNNNNNNKTTTNNHHSTLLEFDDDNNDGVKDFQSEASALLRNIAPPVILPPSHYHHQTDQNKDKNSSDVINDNDGDSNVMASASTRTTDAVSSEDVVATSITPSLSPPLQSDPSTQYATSQPLIELHSGSNNITTTSASATNEDDLMISISETSSNQYTGRNNITNTNDEGSGREGVEKKEENDGATIVDENSTDNTDNGIANLDINNVDDQKGNNTITDTNDTTELKVTAPSEITTPLTSSPVSQPKPKQQQQHQNNNKKGKKNTK